MVGNNPFPTLILCLHLCFQFNVSLNAYRYNVQYSIIIQPLCCTVFVCVCASVCYTVCIKQKDESHSNSLG